MASIVKRPATKYWHAQFRDSTGRLLERTTRATNPKRAQRIAEGFELVAQRQKNAGQLRAAFSELLGETFGEQFPISTVRSFAETWIQNKGPETRASTLATYRGTVEAFVEFLGKRGDMDLADVTRRHIVDWRNALVAKGLAPRTVNLNIQTLRMFFKSAEVDGYITTNPALLVPLVKNAPGDAVSRQAFTVAQIKALLAVADPEWQSLIKFGLYTGQRLGDLARLTWANVDLEREELRLVTSKTGRALTIPLGGPLQAHILDLAHPDELGRPITPERFRSFGRRAEWACSPINSPSC
jgi:integrase